VSCRYPVVVYMKPCVSRAKPHKARGLRLCASRLTQRRHWGHTCNALLARRPAEPCLLGETSWLRPEALLRLLCSAARCAPCALHAPPAELTYSHLHAVQRVGMLHCAGWPTDAAQVQPPHNAPHATQASLTGAQGSDQSGGSQQGDNAGTCVHPFAPPRALCRAAQGT